MYFVGSCVRWFIGTLPDRPIGLYRLKHEVALQRGLAYLSRCNSGWFCHRRCRGKSEALGCRVKVRMGQGTHGYRGGGAGQGLRRRRSWFLGRSAGRPGRQQQEGAQGGWATAAHRGEGTGPMAMRRMGMGRGKCRAHAGTRGGRGIGVAQGGKGAGFRRLVEKNGRDSGRWRAGRFYIGVGLGHRGKTVCRRSRSEWGLTRGFL
jgi:hypothetical protein